MADKAIAVRSTGCSTMNHHARRILLLFALFAMFFLAGASNTVFADETVEIKDIKVELAKGQSVIPMHGVQIHDRGNYYDSLDYTVEGDVPLSGLAIWSIYNTVQPSGAHDTVADCKKLYTTTLQVLIDETVGDKHYTISPDSTLTIGDTEFTYYSANLNTDIGKWFCHYRCKTIRPRYIRVGNKIISFSNKDNVDGDYDVFGDGTVLYDITNNVLTLNNATLKFSKEIADISVANDDLATRPSFIMAMGTDLNINLVGENKFVPAGEVVTDQEFISGIRQTDFESSNYSTVISGDGELAMTFDGGDTSAEAAFPYGFDGNQFILKDNASLSIDFRNCNYTNGIFIGHASTSGILDNAKLTITDDGNCPGNVMGIVTGGDYPFIFGGNSQTIIDISGDESSLALFDNNDLEISDNAKVLLKSNGHALTCNGSLSFFNHDGTALVNMAASEEGRSAWDGESNLSYTYKYIRFPGLTHYEAVPATVEQSGTIEYYYDPWTDKYYSDFACTEEVDPDNVSTDVIDSGSCGDKMTWTFRTGGILEISGSGIMTDFNSSEEVSWSDYKNSISTVVINDGPVSIGNSAFNGCSALENVEMPDTVTTIGDRAFADCSSLNSIEIPASVTSISDNAFSGHNDEFKIVADPGSAAAEYAEDHGITIEVIEHSFGDWITDQEPTCAEPGSRHRECSHCSKVETEEIPVTGAHTVSEWTVVTQATCAAAGSREGDCTVCGQHVKETIPATGQHTWNPGYTVDQPATEQAPGIQSVHCAVCGAVKEGSAIAIPQLGPTEIQDLKAVKISKPKAAKKKVTVKWKKVSKKDQKKIGGIEIQVATDPDFVNIVKSTTAKKSKTNKTIKGLQSKTTYWVRIRAYKNAADGKHVSAWKSKKVKIK